MISVCALCMVCILELITWRTCLLSICSMHVPLIRTSGRGTLNQVSGAHIFKPSWRGSLSKISCLEILDQRIFSRGSSNISGDIHLNLMNSTNSIDWARPAGHVALFPSMFSGLHTDMLCSYYNYYNIAVVFSQTPYYTQSLRKDAR